MLQRLLLLLRLMLLLLLMPPRLLVLQLKQLRHAPTQITNSSITADAVHSPRGRFCRLLRISALEMFIIGCGCSCHYCCCDCGSRRKEPPRMIDACTVVSMTCERVHGSYVDARTNCPPINGVQTMHTRVHSSAAVQLLSTGLKLLY